MGILYKIAILTIFYQIMVFLTCSFTVLLSLLGAFSIGFLITTMSLSMNVSMYLMMDHNESKYIKFLKCMNRFKMDIFCYCCCRYMIIQQLNELDPNSNNNQVNLDVNNNTGNHNNCDSDESVDDCRIKATENENSIATTIVEVK